jgi:hypothetical protein
MVTEDYVKMLVGDNMSGSGVHSLHNKIRSALVNTMNMDAMTGAGIIDTFKNVIKTVSPYVKSGVQWAWNNRNEIRDIASLVL